MERAPPDWLDKELLAEALQKEEERHGKVTVTKFTAKPAVAVGDNYSSYIFRINLTFKEGSSDAEKEEVIILKAPIETGAVQEVSGASEMYDGETTIYNTILPKIYKKLKSHLGPKSYYCSKRGALLLQDLKADGYIVCDRFKQLNVAHCKLFYESLAKYHASSVALHREDPGMIENLGKERSLSVDAPFAKIMKPWLQNSLKNYIKVVKKAGGEQTVVDYLQSKVENMWESLVEVLLLKQDRLNVLNHGDCWTNNMMFKHNSDQKVVDVKLIDFQIPRYNSPVFDVVYFFWTSANEDVRQNHQKELFQFYVNTLNETLKKLGCKERLTFEQLEEDIKSATHFVIWVVSFVQLFIFCEPELALDMGKYSADDFTSGVVDEKFSAIYNGKRFRALLPGVIRDLQTWLISRGVLPRKS